MSKSAVRRKKLDPTTQSVATSEFGTKLRAMVVGQEDGVRALIEMYQVFSAGLNSPGRPIENLLFLGPTGSGKTHIVEAAAEVLFGNPHAIIKVDCAEFQHSHEIAKIIGSPPGYLGHRETHPLITQEALAASHREGLKLSFILFDEIEKASDALWALLLGMMDKATLTLGDNRKVDLSQSALFMTSNLGGRYISDLMTGAGMGFVTGNLDPESLDSRIETSATEAARRKFSPEFMNRFDRVVVFHPLSEEQLKEILNIELGLIQRRVLDSQKEKFLFNVTDKAKAFLIKEGTDMRYGARHLKRALHHCVVLPISNLIATRQINSDSILWIDLDESGSDLSFSQDNETVLATWLKEPKKE
jgi:ATP-dependent Clp protease ATP-binding subunit ClpB